MATDREKLEQQIKSTPPRLMQCFYLAALRGVLLALRGLLLRITARTFTGSPISSP